MRSETIKLIFKRGPVPGLRAIALIILAIVLMVLDQRSAYFHSLRAKLSILAYPTQWLVNAPTKAMRWAVNSVTTQQHVLEDNARLRANELLLRSKLQKLLALERENAQLKELLKSTSEISGKVKVAQLLAVGLDPSLAQVVIDRGSRNHVYVGQPVLDAYGVLGQVVDVGPLTSRILLLSDTRSAIPVEDYRNGLRAVAVGLGREGKLVLINMPDTSDIKMGDLFVTSGLGMRYPVGYPVGTVVKLAHIPGRRFAYVVLQPKAHLDQSRQVLLAWPKQRELIKTVKQQLQAKLPTLTK